MSRIDVTPPRSRIAAPCAAQPARTTGAAQPARATGAAWTLAACAARAAFATCAATLPLTAFAQSGDSAMTSQLVRLVLGLSVVVAVLFAAGKLLPRLGGGAFIGSDRLRVVASLAVGQRERVVVVQVGDGQVMLGVAPGRVELLERLETPLPVKDPKSSRA